MNLFLSNLMQSKSQTPIQTKGSQKANGGNIDHTGMFAQWLKKANPRQEKVAGASAVGMLGWTAADLVEKLENALALVGLEGAAPKGKLAGPTGKSAKHGEASAVLEPFTIGRTWKVTGKQKIAVLNPQVKGTQVHPSRPEGEQSKGIAGILSRLPKSSSIAESGLTAPAVLGGKKNAKTGLADHIKISPPLNKETNTKIGVSGKELAADGKNVALPGKVDIKAEKSEQVSSMKSTLEILKNVSAAAGEAAVKAELKQGKSVHGQALDPLPLKGESKKEAGHTVKANHTQALPKGIIPEKAQVITTRSEFVALTELPIKSTKVKPNPQKLPELIPRPNVPVQSREEGQVASKQPSIAEPSIPSKTAGPREQNMAPAAPEEHVFVKDPILKKSKTVANAQEPSAKVIRSKNVPDKLSAQQGIQPGKDDVHVKNNPGKVAAPTHTNPIPGSEDPLLLKSKVSQAEPTGIKAELPPEMTKVSTANSATEIQRPEPAKPGQFLPRMFNQVEQGIRQAMVMRPKSITMKLMPEELGELKVQVTIEKEMVQAKIQTESHRVATILKDHQTDLEYRMREQGIDLERLDIRDQSKQEERQGKGGQRAMDGQEGHGRHDGHPGSGQGDHPSGSGDLEGKSTATVKEEKSTSVIAGQPLDLTV